MTKASLIVFSLFIATAFLIQVALCEDGGTGGSADIPPPSPAIDNGGGGSHRQIDFDKIYKALIDGQKMKPQKFEELKTLLSKPPYTTTEYNPPKVWVYYEANNTTISRNQDIKIGAMVRDDNPIEIRRVLYLTLETQGPDESEFKPVKGVGTQIIQVNEYNDANTTIRYFPEFTSFNDGKKVGDFRLRVAFTDGQTKYKSSKMKEFDRKTYLLAGELPLKVYNIPPQINNSTMTVNPDPANWDDYIEFTASLVDEHLSAVSSIDQNQETIEVKLYINDTEKEINNITKIFQKGDTIKFTTKDKNIFKESDSGKNFTYKFSSSDGVIGGENTTWTEAKEGPHLRPNPRIRVDGFTMNADDGNYYWWQKYNFALKAKSQKPSGEQLTVAVYTDTPAHPGKSVASKAVYISGVNYTEIIFSGIEPFDVADSNQRVQYYFTYSLPDENGNTRSAIFEGPRLSPKLVRYEIYSPEMVLNLLLIFALAIAGGILLEWRFYRKRGS